VRATLYMATLTAVRHQPALHAFYQRLRERGKPATVALVAAMRKLLAILNAVLKHHTPWNRPVTHPHNGGSVAHKFTGGMFPVIPEPVNPVGNASSGLTFNTVAQKKQPDRPVAPPRIRRRSAYACAICRAANDAASSSQKLLRSPQLPAL